MNKSIEKTLSFVFVFLMVQMVAQPSALASKSQIGKVVSVKGKVLLRNPNSKVNMKELKPGDTLTEGSIINTSSQGSVKLLMKDKTLLDLGASTLFKVDEYKTNGKKAEIRSANVSLEYGKIRALVSKKISKKSKFKLRTRSATMGVRGTEFIVKADLNEALRDNSTNQQAANAASGQTQAPPSANRGTEIIVKEGRVDVAAVNQANPSVPQKAIALTQGTKAVLNNVAQSAAQGARSLASTQQVKVEKVDIAEVNQQMKEVKVEDQTFKQMVVIDSSESGSKDSGGETMSRIFSGMDQMEINLPETEDFSCAGCPSEFDGLEFFQPDFEGYVEATVTFSH